MSRNAFSRLCYLLEKLHTLFLVKPVPIEEDCANDRWKWFKGCLGALDGTYISLRVAQKDRGRYRNRKGDISTNILAVCDINMNYVYKLCGWEGSAADSRVLKDAITRANGFRIPDGVYMPYDPLEAEIPEVDDQISDDNDVAFIDQVEPMNRVRRGIAPGAASKNCRRCWIADEEKALAEDMKDLVVRGYKADNGFKSGYQNLLEQAMMQAFPGTTLKAEPHINS
ncbi:hypothetical protein BUALT_Bualt13G0093200 [Buddleja alternifolia]|uniref:Transposase n=1 Tax=Buddleja alternifolia TaxID=168488 RepID=A0AAV6WTP6_9LAMI|nr:hypothetical protein BUALT_Bualt13G0093200 [Buddleja alternifolia]